MDKDIVNRSLGVGSRTSDGGSLEADGTLQVDNTITFKRRPSYRQAQDSPSSFHNSPPLDETVPLIPSPIDRVNPPTLNSEVSSFNISETRAFLANLRLGPLSEDSSLGTAEATIDESYNRILLPTRFATTGVPLNMSDSKHDPNPLSLSHHGIPPWPARDGGERERVFSPPPVARVGGGPAQSCEPPLRRDGTGGPATHALARGRGEVRDGAGRTAMLHILNQNVTDNWGEPFVPVGPNQRVRTMSNGKIRDPLIINRSDREQVDLENPLASDWEGYPSHTPGRLLSQQGQQVSDFGLPLLGHYQNRMSNEFGLNQTVSRSTSRDITMGETSKNGFFDNNQQSGAMPVVNMEQLLRARFAAAVGNTAFAQTHSQGREVSVPLCQGHGPRYPVKGDCFLGRVASQAVPRDLVSSASDVDEDVSYQHHEVSFKRGLLTGYDQRDSRFLPRGNSVVRSRGNSWGGPGDASHDDSSPKRGGRVDPRDDPSRKRGRRGVVGGHRGGLVGDHEGDHDDDLHHPPRRGAGGDGGDDPDRRSHRRHRSPGQHTPFINESNDLLQYDYVNTGRLSTPPVRSIAPPNFRNIKDVNRFFLEMEQLAEQNTSFIHKEHTFSRHERVKAETLKLFFYHLDRHDDVSTSYAFAIKDEKDWDKVKTSIRTLICETRLIWTILENSL